MSFGIRLRSAVIKAVTTAPSGPGIVCNILLESDRLNFAIAIFGSRHKLDGLSGLTFVNLPTAKAVAPIFLNHALR